MTYSELSLVSQNVEVWDVSENTIQRIGKRVFINFAVHVLDSATSGNIIIAAIPSNYYPKETRIVTYVRGNNGATALVTVTKDTGRIYLSLTADRYYLGSISYIANS